jgi:hypothetical protein
VQCKAASTAHKQKDPRNEGRSNMVAGARFELATFGL